MLHVSLYGRVINVINMVRIAPVASDVGLSITFSA